MLSGLLPDRQQHTLALVVARSVLMGLTEVSDHDRSVDGRYHVRERDVLGSSCEGVTTADAPLRANETCSFKRQKDLFEIGLRKSGSFGDVSDRCRTRLVAMKRQTQQRPAGIVTSSRNAHEVIVGRRRVDSGTFRLEVW